MKRFATAAILALAVAPAPADEPAPPWWDGAVTEALGRAGDNRAELEKALAKVPAGQRPGMAFLVAHMPEADLRRLEADFLLSNAALAYRARAELPWGKAVPEAIFLNDVLPYANLDEPRDDWRREFFDLCLPLVKDCKTPTEAVMKLNAELFGKLKVKYSTRRRAPNQGPKETLSTGTASCTGLSIVLADACRAVGIPARLAGTPMWADKRGNHTWVEVWDGGWHFTGACEADPKGLDRGWFVADAARALADVPEHAIYAASFRRTGGHFPLVWAEADTTVPAENVTARYAKPAPPKPDTFRLLVRVLAADGKRVAAAVAIAGDDKLSLTGTSRGETADTNDLLGFDLPPASKVVVRAGGVEKPVTAGPAGQRQTVEISLPATDPSSAAVEALRQALARPPAHLVELAGKEFARVPLTKADAAAARDLIWKAHAAAVRKERAGEVEGRVLKEGELAMPFAFETFGDKPRGGRSLWISLHGGGGAPAKVNDRQWENQKKLYAVPEGLYLAPRAPTNTWNLWHEPHIDRLFARLIEDLIVLEDVDPDRVYVLGYSAGGDGVYQLAPRLADRWAGAAMMAGHPNGVSLLSLRNLPFALQVGANDAAYDRNKVAAEYGTRLDELRKDDPKGYPHFVKIHGGKGHWMDLEDKAALPWLAKSARDPVPPRVVWKQTGTPHDRLYWLAVPPGTAKLDTLVVAERDGQSVEILKAEGLTDLVVRFDARTADLDKPVTVKRDGKTLYSGTPPRTIATLLRTLAGYGDPKLMFDAEVKVDLSAAK